MRRKWRIIAILVVIWVFWGITMLSLLTTRGFFPYLFEPDRVLITVNVTAEQVSMVADDLEIATKQTSLEISIDNTLSIEAISTIVIRNTVGPVLVLNPGATETFTYMARDSITLARARITARNASIYVNKTENDQTVRLNSHGTAEITADYCLGDAIPVVLSHGATIVIASVNKQYGFLYVWPQDLLNNQALFKVTRVENQTIGNEPSDLSIRTEIVQMIANAKRCAASRVEGSVEADIDHVLRGYDAIEFRALDSAVRATVNCTDLILNYKLISSEFYGQLWINGVPTPPSSYETYLRLGVASACTVTAALLTIILKDLLSTSKTKEDVP